MNFRGYACKVSSDRDALESMIAADVRAMNAESDQIGRHFAGRHDVAPNDFRALLHVMVAEAAGRPLTAGELRNRMGMSGAAITYLVERMIASGHLARELNPSDRRKVMLRVADHGMDVARGFFTPLAEHTRTALAGLPDSDLSAAHRTFTALIEAMRAFRTQLDATSS
jgi:DNA-binding MarR family transcriptional regulator